MDSLDEDRIPVHKIGCGLFVMLALVGWLSYKVILWWSNQTS